KWCLDDEARCGLLVLTRGESGGCVLVGGCLPDVASTRSSEAGAASELFRADLILLRYPDGGGLLPPLWSQVPGDQPALVARIAAHIEAFAPELVLTFDPRHGTTCHPDHRETGRLVLEAVQLLEVQPKVYLLETYVTLTPDGGAPQFMAALPEALRFDATQLLRSGDEAWAAVTWDMERHPSQFTTEFMDAVRHVPQDQRAVFIAPAEIAMQQTVTACP
ncbi:MAG TPA: PIG-L family deacetylase, partial [Thermoanaerobaculia bacterium]